MCETTKYLTSFEKTPIHRVNEDAGFSGLCISIDAGSSRTRTHIWELGKPTTGTTVGIDSGYELVTKGEMDIIPSPSDTLYDNLEIVLTCKDEDKAEPFNSEVRIVKGSLLDSVGGLSIKASGVEGKGSQDALYINTIANIGIRIYALANSVGKTPHVVKPQVTLALPHSDIDSTMKQDRVKARLAGTYTFELPRMDYKVDIEINKETIELMDEAEVSVGYWCFNTKTKPEKDEGIILLDAGGRSVDFALIMNGIINSKASGTGEFGGQKFVERIGAVYSNATGQDIPDVNRIYGALDTGLMRDGGAKIDISEHIMNAKKEIAKSVQELLNKQLRNAGIGLRNISTILCNGRLMKETKTIDGEVSVPSLATYISAYVATVSPNTKVGLIDDEYTLVKGLSLRRHVMNTRGQRK